MDLDFISFSCTEILVDRLAYANENKIFSFNSKEIDYRESKLIRKKPGEIHKLLSRKIVKTVIHNNEEKIIISFKGVWIATQFVGIQSSSHFYDFYRNQCKKYLNDSSLT